MNSKGKKLVICSFKPFGCTCFILNNGKNNLDKFDTKSDEGIFLRYCSNSRSFHVFSKRMLIVVKNQHVIFDEPNTRENVLC